MRHFFSVSRKNLIIEISLHLQNLKLKSHVEPLKYCQLRRTKPHETIAETPNIVRVHAGGVWRPVPRLWPSWFRLKVHLCVTFSLYSEGQVPSRISAVVGFLKR